MPHAYIARRHAIMEQLKALLIDHLSLPLTPDQIDPDAAFFGSGLGLDSVDAMEIVVLVETEYKITLRDPGSEEPMPATAAPDGAESPTLQLSLRTLNYLVDSVMWLQDHAEPVSVEVMP